MRRTVIFLIAALTITPIAARARSAWIVERINLTASQSAKSRVIVTLDEGTPVEIIKSGAKLSLISYGGTRGFVPSSALAVAAPNYYGAENPDCDYGYPYSGSAPYFDAPLTQLRHSGPLGFFLGWHERRPC